MASEQAVIERLGRLFAETFRIDAPSADADLLESGLLDSFQFVELLVQLEQEFGFSIRVDEIELEDLRTLERIARLIAAKGNVAGASVAHTHAGAGSVR